MKYLLLLPLILCCSVQPIRQHQVIESKAHDWKELKVATTAYGETRAIYSGQSSKFKYAQAEAHSVNSHQSLKWEQIPPGHEQLLIVKSGIIEYLTTETTEILEEGSVLIDFPGSNYSIKNPNEEVAEYYLISWKLEEDMNSTIPKTIPIVQHWKEVAFQKTEKGGRRNIIRQPTHLLQEFEMHVTTLNEGEKSHDPHTHIEEEIILVRFGEVEELIDGVPHQVGPGSLIFLRSEVPHGIRNIGKGPCEYYAFKWKVS
ncbi:MAG: quercetin dioxygenase-like cupin family protein [Saprospiraceae bacterium]|jgi:quercetin dioxygenase-like cupin family protein